MTATAAEHPDEARIPAAAEIWAYVHYFRTLRRRRALRRYAYAGYVVAIAVAAYGITPLISAARALGDADAQHAAETLRTALPGLGSALLTLLVLVILRGATWHGPVSLSAADAEWLLPLPVDIRPLMRTRARRSMAAGALIGALGGLAAAGTLALAVIRSAGRLLPLLGTGAGVGALLGVITVAAGVLVQRWATARSAVLTGTAPVVALAAVAALTPWWSPVPGSIALWSGPWGWSVVLLEQTAALRGGGVLVAALLLAGAAIALVVTADEQAGRIDVATLRAQAAGAAGLRSALFVGETREAVLRIRATRGVHTRRWALPLPTDPRLAVAWRSGTSLLRTPARIGGTVLLAGLGITAVTAGWPETGVPHVLTALAGALCSYLAALVLIEPARADADDPARSAPLPIPFSVLARQHFLVPAVLLSILGLIGTPALVGIAGVQPGSAIVSVIGAALVSCAATLAGAFRGRVPLYLLFSGGDYGAGPLALWFLGPLLIGTGLVAIGELTRADMVTAAAGAALAVVTLLGWAGSRAAALLRR